MENQQSPTEKPNEQSVETDEQTDGCWLTGAQGRCRAAEEIKGPWGLAKRGRGN